MFKDTKWAKHIISLQEPDGKWGCFHSLSQFYDSSITTEQALRRLERLGFTMDDECIQKAVKYMDDCLIGNNPIPDRREKLHDWDIFTSLMLAAWIRRFTLENPNANKVAEQWTGILTNAFSRGFYNHTDYIEAYQATFGIKPQGGRLIDFVNFYPISLLAGCLDRSTESALLEYVLNKEDGIYYIYDKCLSVLPSRFESKQASQYLSAIELLARYDGAKDILSFVVDWLAANQNQNGKWDMGKTVNDKVYFPLSDNWRKQETRENDCTERIHALLLTLQVTQRKNLSHSFGNYRSGK